MGLSQTVVRSFERAGRFVATAMRAGPLGSGTAVVAEALENRAMLSTTAASAPYAGLPTAMRSEAGFAPLFNGKNLGGFHTYIAGRGTNGDPQGYFRVQNGMLHVLGLAKTSATLPYGYLETNSTYSNYRIRLEYKWGTAKFAPRAKAARDSGLLVGVVGKDQIWPASLEVQIKEHETGDAWLLPNTGATVSTTTTVASLSARQKQYKPGGATYRQSGGHIVKSREAEHLTGWNTVDVIVEGASAIIMVNGTVVNRLSNLRAPGGAPLTQGRIAIQAEGAEVWYRNIKIKPLKSTPAPKGAIVLLNSSASTAAWQKRNGGGAVGWTSSGGELTVKPGTGDIRTKQTFRDFKLHLEFNVPVKPDGATEQDKGNSGVGLGGSYELQVLDSYSHPLADKNDVGAVYGIRDAAINAALPAGAWESYDVTFTAARWKNGKKIADARVTAYLNGFLVQNNVDIPTSTFTFLPESPAGGPLILQDHNNLVRYRDIWIVPT